MWKNLKELCKTLRPSVGCPTQCTQLPEEVNQMKRILLAMAIMFAAVTGYAEGREHPLDLTATAISAAKGNLRYPPRVSVMFGIDGNGDMRRIAVDSAGIISTAPPLNGAATAVTVIANTTDFSTETTLAAFNAKATTINTDQTVIVTDDKSIAIHVTGPASVWPATPLQFDAAAPLYIPADTPVSLLAGSASIGTLGANSGVDIGDVTVNNTGSGAVEIQGSQADGVAADNGVVIAGVNSISQVESIGAGNGALGLMDTAADIDGLVNTSIGSLYDFSGNSFVPVRTAGRMFNGTTWDRLRGTVANGLDVDVTRMAALVAGSANIGSITDITGTISLPTGAATEATLATIDTDTGNIDTSLNNIETRLGAAQSNFIMDATTQATPKFVAVNVAVSGDNTIVAAVVGKKIRVLSWELISDGTVDARWESGAAGTALTGQYPFVVNSGISKSYSPVGYFETAVNTLLNLELSGAVGVHGSIVYVEVD